MKVLLIVNPVAGKRKVESKLKEILALLEENGYRIELYFTKGERDAEAVAAQRASEKDVVICCGGDGTLSEVANGMLGLSERPPLAYIPAGSTNDFARSMGFSSDIMKAVQDIVQGERKAIDIGRLADRYFMYVASFGAFTQTSYDTPIGLKNLLGHFAYILEGVKELKNLKPYKIKVEAADGKIYEDEYIFGAISNSTSIGGLIHLSDKLVDYQDGLLEVMLIRYPKHLGDMEKILTSLHKGSFDEEFITFFHSPRVSLYSEEPLAWSLDGECAQANCDLTIEVLKQGIELVFPKK